MLVNSVIMSKYLVELTPEEIERANKAGRIDEVENEDLEARQRRMDLADDQAAAEALNRIKKITTWSDLRDNFSHEEKQEVLR